MVERIMKFRFRMLNPRLKLMFLLMHNKVDILIPSIKPILSESETYDHIDNFNNLLFSN